MRIEIFIYRLLIYFNLFTVILYSFSPMRSAAPDNHWVSLAYILMCILLWGVGFKSGVKKCDSAVGVKTGFGSSVSERTISFLFFFYIFTLLPKYAFELGCGVFDIGGMVRRVSVGLADPGLGYLMSGGSQPYSWSLYFLISIIDDIFIIIGVVSWTRLRRWMKYIFVLLCVAEALKWFGRGTNFGVVMMLSTILLAYLSQRTSLINRRQFYHYFLLGLFMFLFALLVFRHNMEGRSGGDFADVDYSIFDMNPDSSVNNGIMDILPYDWAVLYSFIVMYLTGGYTNFECIFDCEPSWCLFLGSNPSKANLADFVLSVDVEQMNYPTQIFARFGIDQYVNWHSCYTWLANDFSLIGVPLIVFLIGKFAGFSLMMYRRNRDLLSGVIFIIFANMCVFFFANNNYISSIFYSFMFVFPIWIFSRYFKVRS